MEPAFVNRNHTEETFCASQSVHSASRWMDKVMDKTIDVGKTGATGFGFKWQQSEERKMCYALEFGG